MSSPCGGSCPNRCLASRINHPHRPISLFGRGIGGEGGGELGEEGEDVGVESVCFSYN